MISTLKIKDDKNKIIYTSFMDKNTEHQLKIVQGDMEIKHSSYMPGHKISCNSVNIGKHKKLTIEIEEIPESLK